MANDTDALLQELCTALLCPYLSDLRDTVLDQQSRRMIAQIPDERYTINNWNEALAYITGCPSNLQTVIEAKAALQKR